VDTSLSWDNKVSQEIQKPKYEKRIFESEILTNNIKCVYVNDIELDRTVVNVCVKIGSLANPKEY
jgi:secreted Zn-dependent insulinase-like peptidase